MVLIVFVCEFWVGVVWLYLFVLEMLRGFGVGGLGRRNSFRDLLFGGIYGLDKGEGGGFYSGNLVVDSSVNERDMVWVAMCSLC